jgi:predicted Zn-dependent protease
MAEYKGTYNPDKKRGELLKDNVATDEYFKDKKGLFKDKSGLDQAKERAEELNNPKKGVLQTLKEKVMGTEEQNQAAKERMRKMDEKDPDSTQAKVNKALGMKKGGSVSSASKRADGCAIRGKTRA